MATASDDPKTLSLKIPPHSLEAERSVLGGLMLDADAWDTVSGITMADDFYLSHHRIIYRCMEDLVEKSQPLDIITISESLDLVNELETVGGLAYLSELASSTPTASNIKAYTEIVSERATVRHLISVAHDIAESGFNPQGRDSTELIDIAESQVFKIGDSRPARGGPQTIRPLLTKAVERIDELFQTKGTLTGLSTGFREVDEMTMGLQPGDMIVVAGRPSMGKTSFAMNIAENAVIAGDKPVLVFSMEMPADALVIRMLSSLGRIDQTKIRSGQLGDDDVRRGQSSSPN